MAAKDLHIAVDGSPDEATTEVLRVAQSIVSSKCLLSHVHPRGPYLSVETNTDNLQNRKRLSVKPTPLTPKSELSSRRKSLRSNPKLRKALSPRLRPTICILSRFAPMVIPKRVASPLSLSLLQPDVSVSCHLAALDPCRVLSTEDLVPTAGASHHPNNNFARRKGTLFPTPR
jgi:hypothetical protein